jgi:hypothetical protein
MWAEHLYERVEEVLFCSLEVDFILHDCPAFLLFLLQKDKKEDTKLTGESHSLFLFLFEKKTKEEECMHGSSIGLESHGNGITTSMFFYTSYEGFNLVFNNQGFTLQEFMSSLYSFFSTSF